MIASHPSFITHSVMTFEIPAIDKKTASDKYQRIIHAAIRVFAEKGFFHAKVADVAHVADVADGTIYLYFKNKDDLLVSIFEHSMDYFIQNAEAKLSKVTDVVEKLRAFVRLHLEMVHELPELAQVLQVELRSSSKFMKEYRPEKFFSYLNILRNILSEGQAAGIFVASIRPDLVKRAIFGAIDELALEWVLTRDKRDEILSSGEDLIEMLLRGILV